MIVLILLLAALVSPASSQIIGAPLPAGAASIEQRLGNSIPQDVPFLDEQGQRVTLQKYLGKPVILALVYYQCPSLCNLVLNGAMKSVGELNKTAGEDFELVALSFDPRDDASVAGAKKANYVHVSGRPELKSGLHFLTGSEREIKKVTDSVGFHYTFNSFSNQYIHPAALIVLTPKGRVSKYFYGTSYAPAELESALNDASNGRLGTLITRAVQYCFHYDLALSKYGHLISTSLQLGGFGTAGALFGWLFLRLVKERKAKEG